MKTTEYLKRILEEHTHSVDLISDRDAEELVNMIMEAKKVFVTGAGRSGLMVKSFAMRMMHMGIEAYVVGETVTPAFEEGDILIIASGSGETRTLVPITEKAKKIGGKVATVTLSPDSTIGKTADLTFTLSGAVKDQANNSQTIQPMGSLFEQSLLLVFDALILRFMEKKILDTTGMYGKHANLE
ncbi:6-phospho-3-hexuloisomerase [Gracilibacillus ureilyticus]|uniref:6-phospho-3-hexuloisomerase n=1 Tax=Gracilibacillus ureilyticus TaxID=531814 RepID=A0A1H9UUJ2_9BACI|nr:6-phospho-3-hexuloisomerase [Gracilibacillus ureilyticus]SES13145.1 6-phospho-3-hexuloisomerase [Gracilibacillus ureilyticus]